MEVLDDCTGSSVQIESCWRWIAAAPGSIEARVDRRAWRNRTVVAGVRNRHLAPLLRENPIPALGHRLVTGEGKGQCPAINRCCPRVGHRQVGREATWPLINGVVDATVQPG